MRFTLHRDKVERKIQTGHTSYECRRSCYLHCGANLRKASPPSGVGLVKGTTTGSSISLSWNQPSDTGGRYACISICLSDGMSGARFLWLCTSAALLCVTVASVHTRVALWLCSPILYYSVLYLPRRGQEEVDRTSGPETTLTLKNLPSEYEISWVKVRAVTKVVDADHCVHLIFYFTFLSNIFALGHTTYKRRICTVWSGRAQCPVTFDFDCSTVSPLRSTCIQGDCKDIPYRFVTLGASRRLGGQVQAPRVSANFHSCT